MKSRHEFEVAARILFYFVLLACAVYLMTGAAHAADDPKPLKLSTGQVKVCSIDKTGIAERSSSFVGQNCNQWRKTIAGLAAESDSPDLWLCWQLDPCASPTPTP